MKVEFIEPVVISIFPLIVFSWEFGEKDILIGWLWFVWCISFKGEEL